MCFPHTDCSYLIILSNLGVCETVLSILISTTSITSVCSVIAPAGFYSKKHVHKQSVSKPTNKVSLGFQAEFYSLFLK